LGEKQLPVEIIECGMEGILDSRHIYGCIFDSEVVPVDKKGPGGKCEDYENISGFHVEIKSNLKGFPPEYDGSVPALAYPQNAQEKTE
jgi:hypothetical protein